MKILVSGPQGSGKTTHSKLISEHLGLPLVDAGNMLRELAKTDTEAGRRVKESMLNGTLSPNDIVGQLIKNRVAESDCKKGFVMDGYPRSLEQLKIFDPNYTQVFYLDLSDSEATQRLLRRGRADDNPELIAKRLELYHQNTEPVLAYYDKLGILKKIDSSKTIEEVQDQIQEYLNG